MHKLSPNLDFLVGGGGPNIKHFLKCWLYNHKMFGEQQNHTQKKSEQNRQKMATVL